MKNLFLTEADGYYGFTTAGKVIMAIIAVIVIVGSIFLAVKANMQKQEEYNNLDDKKKKKKAAPAAFNTKKLVVSAVCIALAVVCSYLKFFDLPFGGSVTILSMFFVFYVSYCFGLKTGLLCGFAYSIFQFIQDPWLLSPLQVLFDYVVAFTALGLGGIFRNMKSKNPKTGEKTLGKTGLIVGYSVSAFARFVSATTAGYLYWNDPSNLNWKVNSFTKLVYPIVYNFSYIAIEAILTIIILMIPGVATLLIRLRRDANK